MAPKMQKIGQNIVKSVQIAEIVAHHFAYLKNMNYLCNERPINLVKLEVLNGGVPLIVRMGVCFNKESFYV